MKLSHIGTLLAALLLVACASFGQASTPQQWTIVTTSESMANADPISYTAAGVYSPCTTGENDNGSDSNADCFNPLTVTTDWAVANGANSVTPVLANTFTNSSCSASGGAQTLTVTGYKLNGNYTPVVTVTMIDGTGATDTITFTGEKGNDPTQFSGTFTSSGSCMQSDTGIFTATLFQTISGTYNGSFESNGSFNQNGTGNVAIALATDSSFDETGTVSASLSGGLCFSNLTIATSLANTYSTSFATGDTLVFIATDLSGNVVVFIASGTSGTGQQEGDNTQGNQLLYLTYYGVAGACSGISGIDVPFSKATRRLVPRHGRMFDGGTMEPGSFGHMYRMRQTDRR
jgi:hypothetical protein